MLFCGSLVSLNETTSDFRAGVQKLAGVSDLFHPPKTTRRAMSPCPSSCLCPCQLVKVDFMACRCFLYDSDRVCEKSADLTMWGQRKPKGDNLKTTPQSEIFKTAARGERTRRGEESEGRVNKRCRRSEDVVKAGEKQRCLYLLTIPCPSSWIMEQMDWSLLNIHSEALGHQCSVACVSSVWYTLLYIRTPKITML